MNFDAEVVAGDRCPDFFEIAGEFRETYSGKKTSYIAKDLQHLIIEDGTFDLSFWLDVLEHVEDVEASRSKSSGRI